MPHSKHSALSPLSAVLDDNHNAMLFNEDLKSCFSRDFLFTWLASGEIHLAVLVIKEFSGAIPFVC